jgi:hypothetical protein
VKASHEREAVSSCHLVLFVAAFLLLAEIHGRIGHFPTLIRMRPQHGSVTTYEVIELLNLQTIRDAARKSSDISSTPGKPAMKSLL